VVPKKLRALKELYFYVQTVEVGFDAERAVAAGKFGRGEDRQPVQFRGRQVHGLPLGARRDRLSSEHPHIALGVPRHRNIDERREAG